MVEEASKSDVDLALPRLESVDRIQKTRSSSHPEVTRSAPSAVGIRVSISSSLVIRRPIPSSVESIDDSHPRLRRRWRKRSPLSVDILLEMTSVFSSEQGESLVPSLTSSKSEVERVGEEESEDRNSVDEDEDEGGAGHGADVTSWVVGRSRRREVGKGWANRGTVDAGAAS